MEELTRSVTLERGGINLETGEFPMILATEGEAMDGHILSIKGVEVSERIPLLFMHRPDPMIPSLGSITNFRKGRVEGVPVLRATGRINVEGTGPMADIRRDMAHLIKSRDIAAVSLRWHAVKAVSRQSLPNGHSAKPTKDSPDEAEFGAFFEKSRALEGSIGPVGVDPGALIGRADAAETEFGRVFWNHIARMQTAEGEDMDAFGSVFDDLGRVRADLKKIGASDIDIANLLLQDTDMSADLVPVEYGAGLRVHIPRQAYLQLQRELILLHDAEREEGESREESSAEPVESREAEPRKRTLGDTSPEEFYQGLARESARVLGEELQRKLAGFAERITGRR